MSDNRSRLKPIRALKYWHYLADMYFENRYIKHTRLPDIGLNQIPRSERIIVSLTSYPARIEYTYYAIKSLMLQTMKADRIILWLSTLQFPEQSIPDVFKELCDKGLEVLFTDDDLRSHKKYYYILREQVPGELVVTYDDDIIYDKRSLERLYRTHLKFPNAVVCDYGLEYHLNGNRIAPYRQWRASSDRGVNAPSMLISPYTGAGCLYPFGVMPLTTFDKEKMMALAFSADDIWMSLNEVLGGVPVVKTRRRGEMLCTVYGTQSESLGNYNSEQDGNDEAVRLICNEYPQIINILKEYIE